MSIKLFMTSLLACLTISLFAQPKQRQRLNFDSDWKFHLGHSADPTKDFNFKVSNIFSKSGKAEGTAIENKFNDNDWATFQLPHDWAEDLPFENSSIFDVVSHGFRPVGGLYPKNSIGWYRKHFLLATADSGQRFTVQFDGVFRDSKVWINGFYLGTNESGYMGMTYDITDYLNFNKENIIVVRVDASQYEGWFYEGAGIYRHVWLNEYNNIHLVKDDLYIHSKVENNKANIQVETTTENSGMNFSHVSVGSYLADRAGKKLVSSTEQKLSLEVNANSKVTQQLSIASPHLWSVEDPYLYRLVSLLKNDNKVIDSVVTRIGIRTVSITNKGLFLNGKYVKIKGVNCHQDHAGLGSALPDYIQYYRVQLLKGLGVNAYRTSHHAPTPELLEACDSLGLLVLDEQRLLNSGPEYLNQFEGLLRRDRNHPSIFLWSIGNEEGYMHTTTVGKRVAQTLLAKQVELDPSRTSTYAADVANVYHGVNEVIPVRGFNYRIEGIDPYHKDHPQQPIIGTEMGSTVTTRGIYVKDTVNAYLPDEDITAPWWANTAEQWWTLAADRPWWIGGFVWTGFDYRGEPTPYEWPNINSHFGILDVCGFPKNIYYYYQSWWTDKDVLHISPHWNWPNKMKGGSDNSQLVNVWVNSNADNVELFLNGQSLGKKDMPRNRHLEWNVKYAPGTLSAVAYKGSRKLESKVETTGDAAEVVITPSKTTMLTDGRDATVINVSVIDKQGREVPDASGLINFKITGSAKIIGVGNGDPSSHELDKCEDSKWQRHLFNGKCQVIIQAGTMEGIIKFEASADKLYPASTEIHSIKPGIPHNSGKTSSGKSGKDIGKMLGADISFLPELESKGMKFSDKGVTKDALTILRDHGMNYVRLRLFNAPANDSGYSPKQGFCDLEHTLSMAKRVKAAGMKFLLDFHYSDYWADPQKQDKPAGWKGLNDKQLISALHDYTRDVMLAFKQQGTLPDMVQVGNEINHGMVWPDGHIGKLDTLANLVKAGIAGVKEVAPSTIIMLHIALGGQNAEAIFFINNMLMRGVQFDVIGLSYYPKWHGSLEDLKANLSDLSSRYTQDLVVVEYSQLKKEVNDIIFTVQNNKGKGSFIWEPLNTWEKVFDKEGNSNEFINIYDGLSQFYLKR